MRGRELEQKGRGAKRGGEDRGEEGGEGRGNVAEEAFCLKSASGDNYVL